MTSFQGPNGGSWLDAPNWTNGLPSAYGISEVRIAYINGGATLNGSFGSAYWIALGMAEFSGNGRLDISNLSTLVTVQTSYIGGAPWSPVWSRTGENSVVNINAGSQWQSGQGIEVGVTRRGELNIASGAKVTATYSTIGTLMPGKVTIDGVGSSFQLTDSLVVGNGSTGTLWISNGATVQNGGMATIGGSGSHVEVNGTWNSGDNLSIKMNGDLRLNEGTVNVGNGLKSIVFTNDEGATGTAQIAILGTSTLSASRIDGGAFVDGERLLTIDQPISNFIFMPDLAGRLEVEIRGGTTIATGNWTNNLGNSSLNTNTIYSTLQIGNGGTAGELSGGKTYLSSFSSQLVFDRSDTYATSAAIDGIGWIVQKGPGQLTLSGALGATATGISDLTFHTIGTGSILVSSQLTTSSNMLKVGTGKLILTGGGQALNGTINEGSIQIGNGGAAGTWSSGEFRLRLGTEFIVNSSNDLVLPVQFTDRGTLTKLGSNKLTLTGSMDGFDGSISIAGTLAYSSNASTAYWKSATTGPGIFRKEGTGTLMVNSSLTNEGGIQLVGGGLYYETGPVASNIVTSTGTTLTLSNDLIYSGALTGSGNLEVRGARVTGTLNHTGSTLASSGDFTLNSTGDSLLSGSFSADSFILSGGNLTLTGAASSAHSFRITGGRAKIGNGGTSGTLSGHVALEGGTLEFSRSDDSSYSGNITPGTTSGSLVKSGAGKLTASGTLSPGTAAISAGTLAVTGSLTSSSTISSGATLAIGDGGNTGTLSGNAENNGILQFNRSTDSTYAGILMGSGRIIKLGDGLLDLTATGGSSGALNVNGGTLRIQNGNTYTNSTTSGIGDLAGVSAAITVSNANSRWLNSSDLYIGNLGNGTLNVTAGGLVRNTFALLGRTGSGTANVTGANSRWENSQGLVVGFTGLGHLNITSGGYVSNAEGVLGADGAGSAVVTGAGSQWVNVGDLDIGQRSAGSLTLGSGATVTVGGGTGTITLGRSGISGGTLTIGQINGAAGDTNGDTLKAAEITGGSGSGTKQIVFDTSSSLNFQPKITGSASVALTGSGRINLNGANTYSGATSITRGTLGAMVNGSLSPNSTLTLANASDAVLQIGTTTQTIASLAGGGATGGSVIMDTGGGLTLGGNNATTAFDGAIRSSAANQSAAITKKGTGSFTLGGSADNQNLGGSVDAGILVLNKSSSSTVHAIGRNVAINSGATLRLSGTGGDQIAQSTVVMVNSGGSFDLGGRSEAFKSLAGSGTVTNSSGGTTSTLTVGEEDGTSTFSGSLADGVGAAKIALTKIGAGTLTLSGNTTIGGGLRLDEGTTTVTGSLTQGGLGAVGGNGGSAILNISGSSANWTSAADTLFGTSGGTGTLRISGGAKASDTFALVGRTSGSTGNITVEGSGSTWTHSAGLVIGTGGTGTMLVSAGGQVTNADGVIGGDAGASGTVRVTDTGSRWTSSAYLVVGNEGAGSLNVDAGGIVRVGSTGTGTLTLGNSGDGSGTLNLGAAVGEAALAAGTIQAGTVTGGAGTGTQQVNFNHTSTAYTFAPDLSGNLRVEQNGGTTTLTGTNTHTGGTFLHGGILAISSDANLGLAAVALTMSGGTLRNLNDLVTTRQITLAQTSTFDVSSGYLTLSTVLSGSGGLTKTGSNYLTLTGAQTYLGATIIQAGHFKIENGSLASSSVDLASGTHFYLANSTGQFAANVTGRGTFHRGGTGTSILTGSLAVGVSTEIESGTLQVGNGATSGTLLGNVVNQGTLSLNRSDSVTLAGTISGNGSFRQIGSGTTVLTNTNTYIGGTTVSAGTLLVNGSILGNTLVKNVAILGGSGIIGGNVMVENGGTLSPGNSPGLLTIEGDLDLNDLSVLRMEFGGTTSGLFDQLDVQGFFTAGGTLNLVILHGFTPQLGQSFTIFTGTTPGFDAGSFSLIVSNLDSDLAWDTSTLATTGVVSLVSAVPEPGSAGMILFGLALCVLRRQRRNRRSV